MKAAFQDMKSWYLKLPWYWKILGAALLVLMGALWVISLLTPAGREKGDLTAVDNLTVTRTDEKLEALVTQEEETALAIKSKKLEITRKINQAQAIDTQTLGRRERLIEASSMDELDALQKEWGL